MRSISVLAVAAIVLVAVPAAGAATVAVSITKSGYTPSTVTATTADTVQFKNNDTVPHQVAFKPATGVTCSPSPFTLQAGQSGTCTFTSAGSFTFSDPTVTGTTFAGHADRVGAAGSGHADALRGSAGSGFLEQGPSDR